MSTLLNTLRLRCEGGANLLVQLGEQTKQLALSALEDEDSVVQKKAARALLLFDESSVAEQLSAHPNDAVRLMGMKHPSLTTDSLKSALKDNNDGVRSAALDTVLRKGIDVELEALILFFKPTSKPSTFWHG